MLNGSKCLKWIIHEMEMETWMDPEENEIPIRQWGKFNFKWEIPKEINSVRNHVRLKI